MIRGSFPGSRGAATFDFARASARTYRFTKGADGREGAGLPGSWVGGWEATVFCVLQWHAVGIKVNLSLGH